MTTTYAQRALLEYMAEHAPNRYDRESIAAALADLDEARAVLRTLEWCVMGDDDDGQQGARCPVCDEHEHHGHGSRCRLGAILAADGEDQP